MSSSCVRRGFLQPQEIQVLRLRVAVASHDSHVNGETRNLSRPGALVCNMTLLSDQNIYLRKSRTVLRVKEPQKEALKKCSATKWPNRATHIHCICILYFVGQVNSRDEQSTEAVVVGVEGRRLHSFPASSRLLPRALWTCHNSHATFFPDLT
jgi:hypothetical protein